MSIELTDLTRYEREKDNVTNLILDANRLQMPITKQDLMLVLNMTEDMIDALLAKLKTDGIIQ